MKTPPDADTWWTFDSSIGREHYVRRLLELYCKTPTTCGRVRRADRHLAEALFRQATPLSAVQGAFHLAAARRTFRDPRHGSLSPVRSLHYFLPVIREVLNTPIDPDYIGYLEWKLQDS
jgi:hypothetical protein